MAFCIIKEHAEKFRQALKSGKINMQKLIELPDSKARIKMLEPFLGKEAKSAVLLIEEKLILKNKLAGLKNAISKIGQVGRYDPAKKALLKESLDEFKLLQKERIFNPKEEQTFLNELADKVIGTNITKEEAETIWKMTSKTEELKKSFDVKAEKWSSEEDRIKYSVYNAVSDKFINDLKTGNLTVKQQIKEYGGLVKEAWGENKPKTVAKVLADTISSISDTLISSVASWDNSFLGRQGGITFLESPKIWWNMAKKSFGDIVKVFKGSKLQAYLAKAEMMSKPNGINGNYELAKLFPKSEEAIPTKVLERIPVLGKGFEASNVAFNNSAIRARADLFDMLFDLYKKTGKEVSDTVIKDIGTHVNAITARGKLGQAGSSKLVQTILWAPKMLKADWDILTGHTFGAGLETNFVRKQSAKTIFRVVVATAATAAIAEAMGAKVEKNPLSSDFLQMKVGNTRFRIPFTRGMTQIVTLIARSAMGLAGKPAYKNTSTGIITKLNTGEYMSKTVFDVGMDFLVNKTTPPAGFVIDFAKGRNFDRKKPTLGTTAFDSLPISIQNSFELKDEATTASILGVFSDIAGIGSNTYSYEAKWENKDTVEMNAITKEFGKKKVEEASKEYSKRVNEAISKLLENEDFQKETNEEREKVIKKIRSDKKTEVFEDFGFDDAKEDETETTDNSDLYNKYIK